MLNCEDQPIGQESAAQRSLDLRSDNIAERLHEAINRVQALWRQIKVEDIQEGGFDLSLDPDNEDLARVEVSVPQVGINTARVRHVVIHSPFSANPTERKLVRVRYSEQERKVVRDEVTLSEEAHTLLQTTQQFEAILPDGESVGWELFGLDQHGQRVKIMDMPDNTELEIEFGNNGEKRHGVSLHIPVRHKNSFWGDSDFLTGIRIFEKIGDATRMVGVTIDAGALAAFVDNKPLLTALHRDRNGTPRILDTDFAAADPQLASVDMM